MPNLYLLFRGPTLYHSTKVTSERSRLIGQGIVGRQHAHRSGLRELRDFVAWDGLLKGGVWGFKHQGSYILGGSSQDL